MKIIILTILLTSNLIGTISNKTTVYDRQYLMYNPLSRTEFYKTCKLFETEGFEQIYDKRNGVIGYEIPNIYKSLLSKDENGIISIEQKWYLGDTQKEVELCRQRFVLNILRLGYSLKSKEPKNGVEMSVYESKELGNAFVSGVSLSPKTNLWQCLAANDYYTFE